MDMSAIDVGTLIGLVGIFFKSLQDKAQAAEQLGRMKQQIKSLETRASAVDQKLGEIDDKLARLIASMTRLETLLNQNQNQHNHVLQTPQPLR